MRYAETHHAAPPCSQTLESACALKLECLACRQCEQALRLGLSHDCHTGEKGWEGKVVLFRYLEVSFKFVFFTFYVQNLFTNKNVVNDGANAYERGRWPLDPPAPRRWNNNTCISRHSPHSPTSNPPPAALDLPRMLAVMYHSSKQCQWDHQNSRASPAAGKGKVKMPP